MNTNPSQDHPFVRSPHRTLVTLSIPVLFSLVAEPLTGLVDTAFIARLGAEPLAALGVGTVVLSSVFWIFNFLGIGAQTEVAQASGRSNLRQVAQINGLALALSGLFGVLMIVVGLPLLPMIATAMGATGSVAAASVVYMQVRLYGTPAVLGTLSIFGVLRGRQDMRTPLWIAVSVNVLNMILDAVLVFGFGPIPALGIAGAAWASVISQWMGVLWALWVVHRRIGWPRRLHARDAGRLMQVGGDLFIRTGLLTLFLLLATRSATRISAESGAAHQAIRQVWIFSALALDAFAITGQSLVGYFLGADWIAQARRVAKVVCIWSLGAGLVLGIGMWLGEELVIQLLVPASAVAVFGPAWLIAILVQPLNALTFATDGIHWGTGDYGFLRNAVIVATGIGVLGLSLVDETRADALTHVWIALDLWILIRAGFGMARIWPGIGDAPLGR